MNTQELETYQAQLEQVEASIKLDPANEELLSLAEQLRELIELTRASIQAAAGPSSSSTGATTTSNNHRKTASHAALPVFAAGDECLAKYSGDDKWYPARITSVGGSEEKRVYSVNFKGYNSTELVPANAVKHLPPSLQGSHGMPSVAGLKRKLTTEEEEERERKKKKNEKKLEVRAAKAKEQDSKKASWQKFATKSSKKGVPIAGVAGTSIFKTPENPLGKVGVTGSGKGMTEVASRGKHKFDKTLED